MKLSNKQIQEVVATALQNWPLLPENDTRNSQQALFWGSIYHCTLTTVEIVSQYNQVWFEKDDIDKQRRFRHAINITQYLTQQAKAKPGETIHHSEYSTQGGCSERLLIVAAPAKLLFFVNDGMQVDIILSSFSFAHVRGPTSTWCIQKLFTSIIQDFFGLRFLSDNIF